MVNIVLASHGKFAEGIMESGSMIFGPQENVAAVVLTPDMGPDDMHQKLLDAIATFDDQEHTLFLVDLWGGTPFNQVSRLISEEGHDDWVAITGLSLPMLVTAYGSRMGADTARAVMEEVYPEARAGVKVKPEELQPADAAAPAAAATAAAPVGAIPEGTVLGDGHIKYAYVRIDTRLLHGQVATAWTKQVSPDRILVVSDGVSHDELRKNMIVQAAPPGVKVHVIPIAKLVEVDKDPRFGATKAMVLFENPQDLLRAEEGGVEFDKVCIGSMAHSAGKTVINQAIACDEEDVKTLEAIRAKGTDFYVQKVPSDHVDDIWALLKEKNMA
ncbi:MULTISPECIES: PTS sugar transporter subunit IIB [Atopobiaceae]|uniref:PTS system mannose-specific EIIAB component n=1 Tax=Parafannyhessea umbonata TaxID=604330 RepID=A0A1H6J3S0_9ACTN|nr:MULTISPECIES: PTS sugar transporter subunit IIB [Atopobiaceae]SEH54114.1 PTS system, mannose-specific IIB component [Parafannyhessea umbonata]SJZ46483.1 PTS system, mannose-specific IIB component [Olsenella sp. KH1P3]